MVNNNFHIKPLIQAFQSVGSYQLLGLSNNYFSIYGGNRYDFLEIEIDTDILRTLGEVLGKEDKILNNPSLVRISVFMLSN